MSRLRPVLVWLGRVPLRPELLLALGTLAAVAFLLIPLTDGRSLVVLAPLGLISATWGYGLLTDFGEIRSIHLRRERARLERVRAYPLASLRISRVLIDLNRRDTPWFDGVQGVNGVVMGAIMIVVGVLFGAGVFAIG